jgi:Mlc titration factor MtfA (ptsG expression regulator)
MLDAEDGTPRFTDPQQRDRWIDVCERHLSALRRGQGNALLSDYAATRPSEFFAVATEAFFTRGGDLLDEGPDLYAVLRDFYGQDPARWGVPR